MPRASAGKGTESARNDIFPRTEPKQGKVKIIHSCLIYETVDQSEIKRSFHRLNCSLETVTSTAFKCMVARCGQTGAM